MKPSRGIVGNVDKLKMEISIIVELHKQLKEWMVVES